MFLLDNRWHVYLAVTCLEGAVGSDTPGMYFGVVWLPDHGVGGTLLSSGLLCT